jgi:hypothetical protein
VPLFLTATGIAVEEATMRLHDPVDAFDVDRRTAFFAALTPEQRMDAPVAVGRLAGDQRLDLTDKLCLGLWATSPPLPGPIRRRLRGRLERATPERIGNRLPGVPSRAGEGERSSRFFWPHQVQRLAQDLVLEGFLAEQPLQFAHLVLQSPVFGGGHHFLAGPHRRQRALGI